MYINQALHYTLQNHKATLINRNKYQANDRHTEQYRMLSETKPRTKEKMQDGHFVKVTCASEMRLFGKQQKLISNSKQIFNS